MASNSLVEYYDILTAALLSFMKFEIRHKAAVLTPFD